MVFWRSKQERFIDSEHPIAESYYELLDRNISVIKMKKELENLIEKDKTFYDPYIVLADILVKERKQKEAEILLYTAFIDAVKRISDTNGNFPKNLEWGFLENRHIIRIIDRWALELWEKDKTEEALEIFRKLLHSNPNDNIGARQSILAIRLGLKPDYEKQFSSKEMPGYLDGYKVVKWFDEQSKKFPDEFAWWFKEVEKQ